MIEHTAVIVINELKAVKWMNMVNTTWSKVELFTLFIYNNVGCFMSKDRTVNLKLELVEPFI